MNQFSMAFRFPVGQGGNMRIRLAGIVVAAGLAAASSARIDAQSLGAFRWQLQPFCNVLTVTIVQQGGQYHVDGSDDLCGAGRLASVVGRAFPNPDGTIGFGLTTVSTTGGAPIHIDARISLAALAGPWTDSAGNTGTFAFTPGAGDGGSVRPIPAGGIAPGSITSLHLAAGAVTAAALAPGAISPSLIAGSVSGLGACPVGQYLRGVQANGSLLCQPIGGLPTTVVVAPPNGAGRGPSVAIGATGLPIVSYVNGTDVRVLRCANTGCQVYADGVVDAGSARGSYTSVAVGTDGFPIVAFQSGTYGNLRVAHCNDAACTSVTATTVDPTSAIGDYVSLAIGGDGLALISHYDDDGDNLRVTHCNNIACTSAVTTVVDTPGSVGYFSSIAIGADNLGIVSHFDAATFDLRVTHCTNMACTAATSATVDSAGNVGAHSSIAIGADGLAMIAHLDAGRGLRISHCDTVLCGTATSRTIDAINGLGYETSIAIGIDSLPLIVHAGSVGGGIRVTHCADALCAAATSSTIGPTELGGGMPSVAIGGDGFPVIAWHTFLPPNSNESLQITKCLSRRCT